MSIKLIAMDIDGTLLDSHTELPAENARAVAEAAARGIAIVLVTGRRFDFARHVGEALPCDVHLIVNNGAIIKSKDGVTHQQLLLPIAIARHVLEAMPEFRADASVVFDRRERQVILESINWDDPVRGPYFRRNREFLAEVSPLVSCLDGTDPIQIMYVGACRRMREAKSALEALPFAAEFNLAFTEYPHRDLSLVDVVRRGVTKGMALAEWARRLGVVRSEIMAIGDNWNDREMLEYAGLPVVMGNSVPELKALGWPLTLTNDECGVAHAIRTLVLEPQTIRSGGW